MALAVTISPTLGSYIESLPAVAETSAVEIHTPYCEPCALMPAPANGVFVSVVSVSTGAQSWRATGFPKRMAKDFLFAYDHHVSRVFVRIGSMNQCLPSLLLRQ